MSDPEGCFVLRDKNKILGYNYSKTMGNEEYLGPKDNRELSKQGIRKSFNFKKHRLSY